MNKIKKYAAVCALVMVSLAPAAAVFAQALPTVVNPPVTTGPVGSVSGFFRLFQQVLNWVAYAFWLFAAIFIFYAAYTYLTAAGDPEKIQTANHRLIYAIVAIVVALFAYGLPALVGSFVGGGTGGIGS